MSYSKTLDNLQNVCTYHTIAPRWHQLYSSPPFTYQIFLECGGPTCAEFHQTFVRYPSFPVMKFEPSQRWRARLVGSVRLLEEKEKPVNDTTARGGEPATQLAAAVGFVVSAVRAVRLAAQQSLGKLASRLQSPQQNPADALSLPQLFCLFLLWGLVQAKGNAIEAAVQPVRPATVEPAVQICSACWKKKHKIEHRLHEESYRHTNTH